jgi:hypothetical protein
MLAIFQRENLEIARCLKIIEFMELVIIIANIEEQLRGQF